MSVCGDFGGRRQDGQPCQVSSKHGRCGLHRQEGQCPNGRPTKYTDEVAERILDGIASGLSLRRVCEPDDLPDHTTVLGWVVNDREGFSKRYARAMEARAWLWSEETIEIADDGENDTYVDSEGRRRTDHDVVQRSKLRVDTRKWMLSRLLPKRFGDRTQVALTGEDGEPLEITVKRTVVPAGDADD